MPKIRSHTLPDGRRRYSFRVDTGRGPDGKRIQEYRTFDRRADAVAVLARIMTETSRGLYIRPSDETLGEYLDGWLEGATRNLRASTRRNYGDAFLPVRERLGARRLQGITKADVEGLVSWMLTSGRRRGGQAGTGLSARSVRLTLGRLTAALEDATTEGKLARNPARYVKPPKHTPRERETWNATEVRAFLAVADADRLAACWRLSLYGLRRGEVLGLRWRDVDLTAAAITVRQARVLAGHEVRTEAPKSRSGARALPLDDALVAALKTLKARQASERLAAGPAYERAGYVAADELGRPVHPEWYTDEFHRVSDRAGVRRIRLHESRHTACSLMEKAGVAVSVIAAWAGHYSGAFTMATYVHASPGDLAAGRDALAAVYRPEVPS
ncbi:MAG TPA: tyrosine-type recombinase/integrase [Streptosporangiaceae bacterium]|jgi:integrase|nr:tyrosine-type recombinase/integrase [Streptosporangiaceae bacterium]